MHSIEVSLIRPGDARYVQLLGQLHDPVLAGQMWADAEHTPPADDDRTWAMALADGEPAAWVAARVVDGELVVSDGYERRGSGRDLGLYTEAYRHLHEAVVLPAAREGIGAVTYVFRQPVHLLERYGWVRTGVHGPGEVAGHEWWELRRDPSV